LKKKRVWTFNDPENSKVERFTINKKAGTITINKADRIQLSEIVPLVIRKKRVFSFLTSEITVSWTALQE